MAPGSSVCIWSLRQTRGGEPVREPVRLAVPWAGVGVLAAQGQEGTCASGLAGAAVTHVHTLLNTHQPPHLNAYVLSDVMIPHIGVCVKSFKRKREVVFSKLKGNSFQPPFTPPPSRPGGGQRPS